MSSSQLILASSSPRRRALLEAVGARFEIRATNVDETRAPDEPAVGMVERLAITKATAIPLEDRQLAIGADTAVVLDGEIFGKPKDEADALRMLKALSGVTHEVVTGVAVSAASTVRSRVSTTKVRFREVSHDEARRYWHSGEPQGKAGAYAIQGRGGLFVEAIMGSYTGVVGLPMYETAELLRLAGFELLPAAEY